MEMCLVCSYISKSTIRLVSWYIFWRNEASSTVWSRDDKKKKKKKRKFHMESRRCKDWKISTIRYRCNAYSTEISRFGRIVIDKEFLSEGKRFNKLHWNERDLGFVKHVINLINHSLYWESRNSLIKSFYSIHIYLSLLIQ